MNPFHFDDALFLLSSIPIVMFGAGYTLHPSLAHLPMAARGATAYAIGALALTFEALVFTFAGIRWTVASLSLPLLVVSASLGLVWRRQSKERQSNPPDGAAAVLSILVSGLAAASLVFLLVSSRAVSVDFLLFYGVKALRFALAQGIDLALFRDPAFTTACRNIRR